MADKIKIPEIRDLRNENYAGLRAVVPVKTELGNLETQIKITENKSNGKFYVNFPGLQKRPNGTVGDDCSGSDKDAIIKAVQASYEALVESEINWAYKPR